MRKKLMRNSKDSMETNSINLSTKQINLQELQNNYEIKNYESNSYEKYNLDQDLDENDDEQDYNESKLSLEELYKKEFKNIIRICDICGSEMTLDLDSEQFEIFICNNCGYKIKTNNHLEE